jgi:hypothetical protein
MSLAAAVPAPAPPNRWLIAAAAFCMQLVLGSVYGWSVLLDLTIAAGAAAGVVLPLVAWATCCRCVAAAAANRGPARGGARAAPAH